MALKALTRNDLDAAPIGYQFFKMKKFRIDFRDGDYKMYDTGITKPNGLIIYFVEKVNIDRYKFTQGSFDGAEQKVGNVDTIINKKCLAMEDVDELVRLWTENATDTLDAINKFHTNHSHNALINMIWADRTVNSSKENRPELWV